MKPVPQIVIDAELLPPAGDDKSQTPTGRRQKSVIALPDGMKTPARRRSDLAVFVETRQRTATEIQRGWRPSVSDR